MPFLFDGFIPWKLNISVQFFNALQTLVMINQGGERICAGLAEKGQAYPFKFPLLLYQKFEIQRRNYHLKSSHALYKKAGGTHIFIFSVSKKSFRHAVRILKLFWKFQNPVWLNARWAFCPPHTPPAALLHQSSAGFFYSLILLVFYR